MTPAAGSPRRLLKVGALVVVVLALFGLAFQLVEPAPPRAFELACGPAGGAYQRFGAAYARVLARRGVTVRLRETRGAAENLALLEDAGSDIEVGFLQAGMQAERDPPGSGQEAEPRLTALGSLYYEPIWIFRLLSEPGESQLGDLRGLRVAIGEPGSGTRELAIDLLRRNGIDGESATLLDLGGIEAARALEAREIDAVFTVGAPGVEHVQALFRVTGARLVSIDRAPAYHIHARYYAHIVLPRGAIDLAADLPPRDVDLLAVPAMLVARDLHPGLIEMLLDAARQVHADGGIFEAPGEFPSARLVDRPLSEHALHYYESGLGFLSRVLPFWAASLVKRLLVLMIPFLGILIPLSKILPALYQWRIRSRLSRWYKALLALDAESEQLDAGELERRLEDIAQHVAQLSVPPAYANALYDLRFHVERVRRRFEGERSAEPSASEMV